MVARALTVGSSALYVLHQGMRAAGATECASEGGGVGGSSLRVLERNQDRSGWLWRGVASSAHTLAPYHNGLLALDVVCGTLPPRFLCRPTPAPRTRPSSLA